MVSPTFSDTQVVTSWTPTVLSASATRSWLSSPQRQGIRRMDLFTRLLQGLKISKISGFLSGRGQTSPPPRLGCPQARLIHDLEKQVGGSLNTQTRPRGVP